MFGGLTVRISDSDRGRGQQVRARLAPPLPIPMTLLLPSFCSETGSPMHASSPFGQLLMGHIWELLGVPCVCLTLGCFLPSKVFFSLTLWAGCQDSWVSRLPHGTGLPCRP